MVLSENGASFDKHGGVGRLGSFALLRDSRSWHDHDSISEGRSWSSWSSGSTQYHDMI